jgi:hypothetical protein
MSERVPWKESNLALIGSDLDHKIKAAAAEFEEQWHQVGKVRKSVSCFVSCVLVCALCCVLVSILHVTHPNDLINQSLTQSSTNPLTQN